MARLLSILGYLVGLGGGAAGGAFIVLRHSAFLRAMAERRDWLAPLKWQLALAAGLAVVVVSLVLGAILVGFGRVWARLDALESAQRSAAPDK